jgi:hypothetical protein
LFWQAAAAFSVVGLGLSTIADSQKQNPPLARA